jgi:transcriptional regulator with XRE-family HTH domain
VADVVIGAAWGRRISARRKALGFSQARLADLLELAQPTISKIERGALIPNDDLKWRLAGALGMPLDELFAYPAFTPPFTPPNRERVAS